MNFFKSGTYLNLHNNSSKSNLLAQNEYFYGFITQRLNFILIDVKPINRIASTTWNLIFKTNNLFLSEVEPLIIYFNRGGKVRVKILDKTYEYVLTGVAGSIFITFQDNLLLIGLVNNELVDDSLKLQFVFKHEIFRSISSVFMDVHMTQNLFIKRFLILEDVFFTAEFIKEIQQKKLIRAVKKVRHNCL